MADKNKLMGDDPLAWLTAEMTVKSASKASQPPPSRRKVPVPRVASTKSDTELVEESFSTLSANGAALVSDFFEDLFLNNPEMQSLFEMESLSGQQKKVHAALVMLVQNLRQPDVLEEYLKGLGARHESYGVPSHYFDKFINSLLTVMKKHGREIWTEEVEMAWTKTLFAIKQMMLSAYTQEPELDADKPTEEVGEMVVETNELKQLRSAVENAMTCIMMIDRDFNITYVNQATKDMLRPLQQTLRQTYPGFDVDALVGANIDSFHKTPSHQRRLLSDPNNLPYSTEINVGPLYFKLNVTASLDEKGHYIGNTLEWANITESKLFEAEVNGQLKAIGKAMGVISFNMDGTIVDINDNFLAVVGYTRDEVIGKHHRMFVSKEMANSADYAEFWAKLNRGEYEQGQFKRIDKFGQEIWLEASYTPILDMSGRPFRVVKYAIDITQAKIRQADTDGQMAAIDKAMGVISFNLDGTVVDINDNFLSVVGYSRQEVMGKHHRMFVPAEYARSSEYAEFWAKLNRGEFDQGQYERVGKNGKEIWLEASYNPIFDPDGNVYKVVKYASDITAQKVLQRTVEQALDETSYVMNAMAEGDLTKSITGEYEGEFDALKNAVNDSVSRVATIVQEISEASISISAAASEISQGNIDLSQRTEEQASSLEETAASMEQLTGTVRQNSDNARLANSLASEARDKAEKGGIVIQKAITAMSEINQASKKVADIIGVIDEIAFQTNLLALNAAVEAARAGDQGRGFAVVASEVRNLAQRSAAAAKEIKSLIQDSGEKVREGSELVDESGRTLENIVEGAKKTGDIIAEIAAASIEQTAGIEQVNRAVSEMDEMTQQNAALVEEAAAASESLDEQGQGLQKMMAFFDTGETFVQPPRSPKRVKRRPVRRAEPKQFTPKRAFQTDDEEWEEF